MSDHTTDEQRAKWLSRHGDPFHVAFYQHLWDNARSPSGRIPRMMSWKQGVLEFPVVVGGKETRIDIVFAGALGNASLYIVGECKAVNSDHTDCWFFNRSSLMWPRGRNQQVVFETLREDEAGPAYVMAASNAEGRAFNFGCAIRAREKRGGGRLNMEAVEGAARQVMLGANGITQQLADQPSLRISDLRDEPATILPAIFTTAELRTAEYDFASVDVESGEIDVEAFSSKATDWLLYTYPGSALYAHQVERRYWRRRGMRPEESTSPAPGLNEAAAEHYWRTIAVVTPAGVGPFLDWCDYLRF